MMTGNGKLVSIGMPAYNGAKFMRNALDTLLAQEYRSFELIISDNCSSDGTWEISKEYAARDSRIILTRNHKNIGMAQNFLKVLRMARGQYFMWAQVDDFWEPDFVGVLVMELDRHPEACVAMSAVRLYREGATDIREVRFTGTRDPNNKTYRQMLNALASRDKYNYFLLGLFRRDILEKAIVRWPVSSNPERIILAPMALAFAFRYVDRTLYHRLARANRLEVRYPDEHFGLERSQPIVNAVRSCGAFIGGVFRSEIVPMHRKWYAAIVGLRFLKLLLMRLSVARFLVKVRSICVRMLKEAWQRMPGRRT